MDHDAVPGLGLPLRWHQENQDESAWIRHRDNPFFASALDGSEEKRGEHVGLGNYQGPQPLTVAERRMLSLINDLTDRADWHRIVFDQQFVNEWKSSKLSEPHTTQRMLDWCISEVQDYAGDFAQTNIVPALDRGVFKSDNLLASALSDDLSQAMAQLQKDASHNDHASVQSNVTLQIVDPALYPFSFAKSPCQGRRSLGRDDCIEHCGLGHIIGVPQDSNGPCDGSLKGRGCYAMNHAWSLRYQWLPFEVKFNAEDPTTRIASYINNVHPVHHAGVYSVLEKIIDKTIPLFNRCLTSIETPSRFYKTRIDVECTEYGDVPNREPGEYQTLEARTQWHYLRNKSRERPSVDLRKDFRDSGLQFIVEASSINMDPLLPDWDGDCGRSWWKMQGQLNERICATVLYFYDCDDLQEGSIHFQQRVSNDEAMELNTLCETAETEEVYDIQDGRATIQELGVVDIRQGRMIAFPNTFRTRRSALRLRDRTHRGHCKFLTLHLIDPRRPIISTAMVPCQRRDWWAEHLHKTVGVFSSLPQELFDRIIELVEDFPISRHDANVMREEHKIDVAGFAYDHEIAIHREEFNLMTEARRHEEELGYH